MPKPPPLSLQVLQLPRSHCTSPTCSAATMWLLLHPSCYSTYMAMFASASTVGLQRLPPDSGSGSCQ
jgi:hypothetical protein